jgi:hypothetical protein
VPSQCDLLFCGYTLSYLSGSVRLSRSNAIFSALAPPSVSAALLLSSLGLNLTLAAPLLKSLLWPLPGCEDVPF